MALRASLVFGWTQRLTAEVIADSDDRAVALHLPGPFDHERFCDEAFLLLSPVMYDFYGVENLHTTAQHLEFATDDVVTQLLTADYERQQLPRRSVWKRLKNWFSHGSFVRRCVAALYLAAATYQKTVAPLRERLRRLESSDLFGASALFRTERQDLSEWLGRDRVTNWLATADRASESYNARAIAVATVLSAVLGGAAAAVLGRVIG